MKEHVVEVCPECEKAFNCPSDAAQKDPGVAVVHEIKDTPCGKCEAGVDNRDEPL